MLSSGSYFLVRHFSNLVMHRANTTLSIGCIPSCDTIKSFMYALVPRVVFAFFNNNEQMAPNSRSRLTDVDSTVEVSRILYNGTHECT